MLACRHMLKEPGTHSYHSSYHYSYNNFYYCNRHPKPTNSNPNGYATTILLYRLTLTLTPMTILQYSKGVQSGLTLTPPQCLYTTFYTAPPPITIQ